MSGSLRFIIGLIVALFVTGILFLLMRGLISKDFVPQEKTVTTDFEINPKIEDVEVLERDVKPDELEDVTPPPPPPRLPHPEQEKPTESIVPSGRRPELDVPEIEIGETSIQVADREPVPVFRVPPIPPRRFEEGNNSGYCKVRFDVNADGDPFNISIVECTNTILENPTIKSVRKWKYNPKIVDGRAVARTGVESRIKFNLTDERGQQLPLPAGFR